MEAKDRVLEWFKNDPGAMSRLRTELNALPDKPTILVTVDGGIVSIQRLPKSDLDLSKINIVVVDMDVIDTDDEAQISERFDASSEERGNWLIYTAHHLHQPIPCSLEGCRSRYIVFDCDRNQAQAKVRATKHPDALIESVRQLDPLLEGIIDMDCINPVKIL